MGATHTPILTNGVVAAEAVGGQGDLDAGDEVIDAQGIGEVLQHQLVAAGEVGVAAVGGKELAIASGGGDGAGGLGDDDLLSGVHGRNPGLMVLVDVGQAGGGAIARGSAHGATGGGSGALGLAAALGRGAALGIQEMHCDRVLGALGGEGWRVETEVRLCWQIIQRECWRVSGALSWRGS